MEEKDGFYYSERHARTVESARRVLGALFGLYQPRSVVDVGCGVGTWLRVCMEYGVQEVLGMDGDHVDGSLLEIPSNAFLRTDLCRPISVNRRFNLVTSMEVAEHLPSTSADGFVASLVRLGTLVMFGAAIPHQGGFKHINEHWPSYWATRFLKHDYVAVDAIRPRIWHDNEICFWYRQNTILFVDASAINTIFGPKDDLKIAPMGHLDLVHPMQYESSWREHSELGVRLATRVLVTAITRSLVRRFFAGDRLSLR